MAETIELAKAYVQVIPSTKGIQGKLTDAMNDAGDKAGKSGGAKLGSGLSQGFAAVGKAALAGVTAASVAVGTLVTKSVQAYSEYEQLVGGVETLFGEISSTTDASTTVITNASNAWKTAGMDANTYMETATSFAASLMDSLENDAVAASAAADMAVTDMADNANKMGTSMESIQNAYQGFAKQNYTMLDNLKLGYGGTKEEMQRLLTDAQELTGVKYDISNLSDVYEAIHEVQKELGISGITAEEAAEAVRNGTMTEQEAFDAMGTTAKEASTTIQGSFAMTSAAWSNLVTGMGDKNADVGKLVSDLVESVGVTLENLIPVAKTALSSISTVIGDLGPVIAEELPGLVAEVSPSLFDAALSILQSFGSAIIENLPSLISCGTDIILGLVDFVIQALPDLISAGLEIILSLASAITSALPELIPAIVDVVMNITENLIDNVDMLIDASIELILALADGLISSLPLLIEKGPIIVEKLMSAIIRNAPKLLEAAYELIVKLGVGITDKLPELAESAVEIVTTINDGIKELKDKLFETGKECITNLWNGINNKMDWIKQKIRELGSTILSSVRNAINGDSSKGFQIGGLDFEGSVYHEMQSDNVVNKAIGNTGMSTNYDYRNGAKDIDYNKLANAMLYAMQDMTISVGDREFGRLVRRYS